MKIYVCVKHVPDSAATIKIQDNIRIGEDITFLLNPYDENAVTAAADIKEAVENTEVIAVSVGKEKAADTIRSALAMGADRGILIRSDETMDCIQTAKLLYAAIAQDGDPDIIITGRESIDGEGMQTMFRLAAAFHFPVATNVASLSLKQSKALVECELEPGAPDRFELDLPCVIGTAKSLNQPRYPTFPDIVKARKKEIRKIEASALTVWPAESGIETIALKPLADTRRHRQIKGTPDTAARELIRILRDEAKVLNEQ